MNLPLTYEQSKELMHSHIGSESLRGHCESVEKAMRHYAKKLGEDPEYWGIVGLLHDLDYEKYPDEHCKKTPDMLREAGFDEEFINSVLSHGYNLCTDVEPIKPMEKVLYTVDELTGFVNACALVRPSKNLEGMEVKSVRKKFKTENFAAKVNRQVILSGCAMMGCELDEAIAEVIVALS